MIRVDIVAVTANKLPCRESSENPKVTFQQSQGRYISWVGFPSFVAQDRFLATCVSDPHLGSFRPVLWPLVIESLRTDVNTYSDWDLNNSTNFTVNDLSGGPWKTRKRKCKKSPARNVASKTASSPGSEESNTAPGSDFAIVSQFPGCSLLSTPKRGGRQTRQTKDVCLTSTPVRSSSTDKLTKISKSPPGAKQAELEYTEVITQLKVQDLIITDDCCFCMQINPVIII